MELYLNIHKIRVQMTLVDFFSSFQSSINLSFYLYHIRVSMNTASFFYPVVFFLLSWK